MDIIHAYKEHLKTLGPEATSARISEVSKKYEYLIDLRNDWQLNGNKESQYEFRNSGRWKPIRSSNLHAVKNIAKAARCAIKQNRQYMIGGKVHWVFPPGFLDELLDSLISDIRNGMNGASDTTRDFFFSMDLGL
ncbi:hypothetical protein [Stutzerimonas nitrititolerans]|uniref:hypothetical protein n=1 Tax=Stutzerimonas nitrititolerans TaxID=2482751 RepID=UPI00289BC850|nr:hypothetical protein [Stutzerimonas nitrititolerans]